MRVLYDYQMFINQTYGGISRYFYELLNMFSSDNDINASLAIKYSNNHYLESATFCKHKTFFKNSSFKGKDRFLYLTNNFTSKQQLKRSDFDVFHPTYHDPYFLKYLNGKPFVLTICDMIHEIYPKYFKDNDTTSEKKKLLAQKASKIIAISQNTKKDIIKYYGIDETKIEVVYLANSLKNMDNNLSLDINLPPKFILFVGNRDGYKNFKLFVEAISELLLTDKSLYLVCAGGRDFEIDELKLFNNHKILKKVLKYGADNDTLIKLYSNATVFVFPSLYEGFGIPILEALDCDCPAALSNTSSLPEVAENAAIYFDPYDKSSINDAIKRIIYNDELRNTLIQKGYKQAKKFSWENTAKKTKDIYRSTL